MSDYKLEEVSIEITNECVLNCKHCSSVSGKKGENELSRIEIKNVIRQAKLLGASVISLSGGDPILSYSIFDIIRYIRQNEMDVLLYTTGIIEKIGKIVHNLDKRDMCELSNLFNDNSAIIFSIEGNRKSHDFITGVEGSFNATIR